MGDRPPVIRQVRRRRADLAAMLGYSILSIAYLWPLVRRFGTAMAGDGFDRYVFQWTNWWITHALSQGKPLYHTEMIFYPQGVDLYFLSFSWLNTFVWWPLQALVGNLAAYNFTVWWSWPLAGFGAYLLGREVFGDRRAAFIAGLIYAFFPYHFAQRNHLNLLSIQWIPFSLLFLIRLTRRGRWRDGCLSGLFFAFSGLSSWHLMTLSGMLGGMWLLYTWLIEPLTERSGRSTVVPTAQSAWSAKAGYRPWRPLLALLVTAAVLTGPFLAPLVWEQFANPAGQDPYLGKEKETQTDLVAYFVPNLYHPLWGHLAAPVHRRFLRNKDHAVALGYVPLALVVYGLSRWRKDRRIRFWLIALLVFWILSLGPFPRINGEPYPRIPLPYQLVGWSFPVRSLRNPERFNIIVSLCLALVAGNSVAGILKRVSKQQRTTAKACKSRIYRKRRSSALIAVVLSAIVLLEYWSWPFPTRPANVPAGYQQIAIESGNFAIVDLPISNDLSKQYMYYQTVHCRPTVTGHVSRPPADAYAFIEGNDLSRSMWQGQRPDPEGDLAADLAALADADVRYVVVHRAQLTIEDLTALEAYLSAPRRYADNQLLIYSTSGKRYRD